MLQENVSIDVERDTLFIIPSKGVDTQKIYLTKSNSAWITIEWLPEELICHTKQNYQHLFELHPAERGNVVMYNEDIESVRWHQSYLNTPEREISLFVNKSYMYSAKRR